MKTNIIKDIKIKDLTKPSILLATWFGCGLAPKAPGTWGSIGSIPPALALYYYGGLEIFLIGILIIQVLGYWSSYRFEALSGTHDNKMIVIDEAVGQWIALIPAFVFFGVNASPIFIGCVLLSLALFRFFDILKPWPIGWIDKNIKNAAGVMGDDILAGIFAAFVLWGILHVGLG